LVSAGAETTAAASSRAWSMGQYSRRFPCFHSL
jgi:hypothetical protein